MVVMPLNPTNPNFDKIKKFKLNEINKQTLILKMTYFRTLHKYIHFI